jgi:hypothetical protein
LDGDTSLVLSLPNTNIRLKGIKVVQESARLSKMHNKQTPKTVSSSNDKETSTSISEKTSQISVKIMKGNESLQCPTTANICH